MSAGAVALFVLVAFAIGYAAGRTDRVDLGPLRRIRGGPPFDAPERSSRKRT